MQTKSYLLALLLFSAMPFVQAQTPVTPSEFQGAKATKARYQVVYQLNSDNENSIKGTLKNIQNALDDARLKVSWMLN